MTDCSGEDDASTFARATAPCMSIGAPTAARATAVPNMRRYQRRKCSISSRSPVDTVDTVDTGTPSWRVLLTKDVKAVLQ
jgi:hypothetical protein